MQMVRVEDSSAWDCRVELYSAPDPRERHVCLDDVDVRVALTMGKTRLLLLNSFLSDVLVRLLTLDTLIVKGLGPIMVKGLMVQ
jgi:hypothetical protein